MPFYFFWSHSRTFLTKTLVSLPLLTSTIETLNLSLKSKLLRSTYIVSFFKFYKIWWFSLSRSVKYFYILDYIREFLLNIWDPKNAHWISKPEPILFWINELCSWHILCNSFICYLSFNYKSNDPSNGIWNGNISETR